MKKFTIILALLLSNTAYPREPMQLDPITWTTDSESRICFTPKGAKRLLEITYDYEAQLLSITTYKSLIYNLENQVHLLEEVEQTQTKQLMHMTKQNIILMEQAQEHWYESEVLWFTLGIIVTVTVGYIIYEVKD